MTGYTVHSGSNEKFADGWDRIFGNEEETEPDAKKPAKKPAAAAKRTRKPAKKGRKKS